MVHLVLNVNSTVKAVKMVLNVTERKRGVSVLLDGLASSVMTPVHRDFLEKNVTVFVHVRMAGHVTQ